LVVARGSPARTVVSSNKVYRLLDAASCGIEPPRSEVERSTSTHFGRDLVNRSIILSSRRITMPLVEIRLRKPSGKKCSRPSSSVGGLVAGCGFDSGQSLRSADAVWRSAPVSRNSA
jgi:hypothetical protein